MNRKKDQHIVFKGFFLFALFAAFVLVSVGIGNTILDNHYFRQTQTAITAYYILSGGPVWAYETPVLGAPWSIPFEFPLYQLLVAWLSNISGLKLDIAGRVVAISFYFMTLIPLKVSLRNSGFNKNQSLLIMTLFLLSPIYLFYSRTFLMESTAFFLSVCFYTFSSSYIKNGRTSFLLLGIGFGGLAALVKITTLFGISIAFLALYIYQSFYVLKTSRLSLSRLVGVGLLLGLPVLMGVVWTKYADFHKSLNPLAAEFITSDYLAKWNFGSWDQRFSGEFWGVLYHRLVARAVGVKEFFVLSVLLLAWYRPSRSKLLVLLVLAIAPPLVFANLYLVHDYYAYANSIFVIIIVALGIDLLLDRALKEKYVFVAIGLVLAANIFVYVNGFLKSQLRSSHTGLKIALEIKKITKPSDVILIYGRDWSPEVPYYAERRAIMDREGRLLSSPAMTSSIAQTGKNNIGAMLVCGDQYQDQSFIEERVRFFQFSRSASFSEDQCGLYY